MVVWTASHSARASSAPASPRWAASCARTCAAAIAPQVGAANRCDGVYASVSSGPQTVGGRFTVAVERSAKPPVSTGSSTVTLGQSAADQQRTSTVRPASSDATRPNTGSIRLWLEGAATTGSGWAAYALTAASVSTPSATATADTRAARASAHRNGRLGGRAVAAGTATRRGMPGRWHDPAGQ